ncbi:MAG: TetR/AcrR family transcriptional regulator [Psychrilyobacter sp.]|nr:TetR/AcrR family transcriptional regulator [Psychrilyobacter sp.]
MQIKKKEVKEKIYNNAIKIFKAKGYKKTTMKEISEKSKVPIGNIYIYYKNKADLFDSIVFEVYSNLKYSHIHEKLANITNDFEKTPRKLLKCYIENVIAKPTEFTILFDSSSGTKYENFVEELVDMRWEKTKSIIPSNGDPEFVRLLLKSGITSIIDICKKYKNDEKLLRYYLVKFDYFFRSGIVGTRKEK